MTKDDRQAMAEALRMDWGAEPPPTIPPARQGRHRLPDLDAQMPGPGAVFGYVRELIAHHQRQYGPRIAIGADFARAVRELPADVPAHARTTLEALGALTARHPVPASDAALLAHGITSRGRFAAWVQGVEFQPKARKQDTTAAYRLLAQKLHPDRGGDTEAMQALNELRDASR